MRLNLHLAGIAQLRRAFLFVLLLGFTAILFAQTSQKVIKDPTEYNAYMTALNTADPAAKGAAMEAFAQQYPQSVMYVDALEQAMAAWQQVRNSAKVLQLARRIVTADAGNVRALAVVVALDRTNAAQGDKPSLDELCPYSSAGMREVPQWKKPEGMTDRDFASLRSQMDGIFNGAASFCALQQANYSQARDFLARAVAAGPDDLQNTYQLAVAELEMKPLDADGFWYCARAIHLAGNNTAAVGGMTGYCKAKYRTYHGADEGWDGLLAAAATQNSLPEHFAKGIKPAPPSSQK